MRAGLPEPWPSETRGPVHVDGNRKGWAFWVKHWGKSCMEIHHWNGKWTLNLTLWTTRLYIGSPQLSEYTSFRPIYLSSVALGEKNTLLRNVYRIEALLREFESSRGKINLCRHLVPLRDYLYRGTINNSIRPCMYIAHSKKGKHIHKYKLKPCSPQLLN